MQKNTTPEPRGEMLTTATGCPVAHNKNSLTAGPNGPVLMQDFVLLDKIGHFTREKTPARNVHALGTGAYGTLTITNDISKYTSAKLFSSVGKKTELFARFSGIFTEQGEPDTTRDPRGFAIKFYTEEGNWDLMGINTPVFNLRDAKLGPDAIHAFKRDPRTGMWNPTQVWDFVANHPESLHQTMMLYTDRGGCPMSYRHMHAYGCHTFSLTNESKERFWVKFHILSNQGAGGLDQVQAKLVAGEDPNFLSRDLRQAIDQGNFPTWRFCCQIMPEDEGYKHSWTFDPTKVWKHKDYPLIDIGVIEMNRNPINFHSEVEQAAFAPTSIVPGIGYSPDKLLQGRLLIYDETQYHRLGANYKQIPINCPLARRSTDYVGGPHQHEVQNKFPAYFPSSFGGPQPNEKYLDRPFRTDGPADFYDYPGEGDDWDYYGQSGDLWRVLDETAKQHLADNVASSLKKVESDTVVKKMLFHIRKIDAQFGEMVERILTARKTGAYKFSEAEHVVAQLHKQLLPQDVTSARR